MVIEPPCLEPEFTCILYLRNRSAAKTEARPTGRSHSKSYLIVTLTSLEVYRVSRTLR